MVPMSTYEDNRIDPSAGELIGPRRQAALVTVAVAAIVGRLPALGAWWNQDDWGLLARATGLVPAPDVPIRWLSQTAYWSLLWPLAGLDPVPYAATRIALHALAAVGVARLAGRLGLAPAAAWLAGLVMAATPLAFSALYWASGVQDLLAVAAMVWALERWSSPGRWGRPLGAALAIAAVAAKETVVGLPLLMMWLLVAGPGASRSGGRPSSWLLVAACLLAAAAATALALRFFATGAQDPYALGDPLVVVGHLLVYGLWLLLPGPHYPTGPAALVVGAGGLLWLAWAAWSVHQWRRGRPVVAFTLLGALLMLAPLLPLRHHLAPDLAYPVEPFGCLALASLWPRRWNLRRPVAALLLIAAVAGGWFGMRARLDLRDADGRLADPLVRRTAVSAEAARHLRQLPAPGRGLVFLLPPASAQEAAMARQLGENWVTGSILYHSLGGTVGPRLLRLDEAGRAPRVLWTNGLRRTPQDALVFLASGERLLPWGDHGQALLYQTLTDLGHGHLDRARQHLVRASLTAGQVLSIAFNPDLLPVPIGRLVDHLPAFHAYLGQDHPGDAVELDRAGLQTNLLRLVSACTGRTVDELVALVHAKDDP